MKGGQPQKREPEPDLANLSQAEIVSSQEATVLPWFVGERKIALAWITPVYNPFARDIPGGGKGGGK